MHLFALVLASLVYAAQGKSVQMTSEEAVQPPQDLPSAVGGARHLNWNPLRTLALLLGAWSSPSAGWQVFNPSAILHHTACPCTRHVSMKAAGQVTGESLTEEQLQQAHIATVQEAVQKAAPSILHQLESNGYAIVDNFLPTSTVSSMCSEAESLYRNGELKPSETDAWIESEGRMGVKQKKNILYCALKGGQDYFNSPRMHEYMAFLGNGLVPLINSKFDHARLGRHLENKLAVCLGDGSRYEKHFDVGGPDDVRKLTALLYLHPGYEPSQGGCFRVFTNGATLDGAKPGVIAGLDEDGHTFVDISPIGGRLLVFWADTTIHSVTQYSATENNPRRWAITVWIGAEDATALRFDKKIAARHFAPNIVDWLDGFHVGTKL